MEGRYAIFLTPESLTEPGSIGWVVAGNYFDARRQVSHAIKGGFDVRLVPEWFLREFPNHPEMAKHQPFGEFAQ